MKIKLTKKLTKSQKQEFIYRDKTYNWDSNYEKLLRDYVEADWSYDKDNRHNLCDGEQISDIVFDDIYKMICKCGLKLEDENKVKIRAKINKAISKLCKENEFSIKKNEKEEKEEEKEENLKNLPDRLRMYVNDLYGNSLSYNISNNQAYYNDKPISNFDIAKIIMLIQSNLMFKNINKSIIKTIIYDVAKSRKFEEKLTIDETVDKGWNILKDVDEKNWQDYLKVDSKNRLIHSTFNYSLFLSFHPQFRNNISYNSFDKIESLRMFDKDYGRVVNKPIDDDLANIIKALIEQFFGDFNTKYLDPALSVVLNNNSYHEIKQKFKKIEDLGWDGNNRMHEIMIKYFGCEDCNEIREMTEVMLCGSVQRILEEKPDAGTMFDYMGIMFGKQGTGKTKFMTRLYFGDKYTSINPDINDDQKFTDLTNRSWLVLFDEMKSIDKADMGTVKSRITEQGANVRLSYGRRSKYYPRHCNFWGNTNYKGVLRDEGYERRFLCFECKNEVQHEADWWEKNYTDYDIDQIWAETLMIYHEKYEGKVIEISRATQNWNYKVQIRHKIWVEDSRTDLELKEILNCKQYLYPYWTPEKWRIWMKQLDQLKINGSTEGKNELKLINCKWVLSRIQRKSEWITGMVEQLGWKKIHVNHPDFGNEDYYIRGDITFEDVINDWNSYASAEYGEKNSGKNDEFLPF